MKQLGRARIAALLLVVACSLLPAATCVARLSCVADCNRDGEVSLEDLVIATSEEAAGVAGACETLDADASDDVSFTEVIHVAKSVLSACTPPRWRPRASLPQARQEVGVAELAGRIYVVGGFDERLNTVATVERYDPDLDMWSATAPLPEPLHHVMAATVGGRLYVIGGLQSLRFTAVASVFEYDATSNSWSRRADLPSPRGAGGIAVIGERIFVAGGFRQGAVNDFAAYDVAGDRWEMLPPMPTARDHLGAAAMDGLFYAVGGRDQQLFDVVEVYDPVATSWSLRRVMPTARGGLAVAALEGLLFAIGGEGNPADHEGIFRETEAYDPATDTWRRLPHMLTPRHGTAAVAWDGVIYVPAGATTAGFGAVAANEVLVP